MKSWIFKTKEIDYFARLHFVTNCATQESVQSPKLRKNKCVLLVNKVSRCFSQKRSEQKVHPRATSFCNILGIYGQETQRFHIFEAEYILKRTSV